jgi:hypothetical protein
MTIVRLRIGISLIFCLTVVFSSNSSLATPGQETLDKGNRLTAPSGSAMQRSEDGSIGATLPPGTVITMQNWQRYKQYMPDGMVALFEGEYFWKMPAHVSMEVGPTIIPRCRLTTLRRPRNILTRLE